MQPIAYARHCIGCHPLLFDKRFTDSVPHDTPEVIHVFLAKRYTEYIATHPAELREAKSTIALPAKPVPISPRVYTPQEWVNTRVGEAENLLWRKTCKQCHALSFASGVPSAPPAPMMLPAGAAQSRKVEYPRAVVPGRSIRSRSASRVDMHDVSPARHDQPGDGRYSCAG